VLDGLENMTMPLRWEVPPHHSLYLPHISLCLPISPYASPISRCISLYLPPSPHDQVPPQNFDTTPNAVLTLFQCMFLDGWSGFMFAGADTRGVYLQPNVEHNTYSLVYFISFTFIGPLFFMNLIIGAVVSTFEELHRKGAGIHIYL